jgi:hypothetical protein
VLRNGEKKNCEGEKQVLRLRRRMTMYEQEQEQEQEQKQKQKQKQKQIQGFFAALRMTPRNRCSE